MSFITARVALLAVEIFFNRGGHGYIVSCYKIIFYGQFKIPDDSELARSLYPPLPTYHPGKFCNNDTLLPSEIENSR